VAGWDRQCQACRSSTFGLRRKCDTRGANLAGFHIGRWKVRHESLAYFGHLELCLTTSIRGPSHLCNSNHDGNLACLFCCLSLLSPWD
jgi:hypothetical protein